MNPKDLDTLIYDLMGYGPDKVLTQQREDTSGNISLQGSSNEERYGGRDVPGDAAVTMIGYRRLKNFADLISAALENNILGNVVETGVWRGGACILAARLLEGTERRVYVCDSFKGLPPPSPKYWVDEGQMMHTFNHLRVSKAQVIENFKRFDALSDNVIMVEGFFDQTLPTLDTGPLCCLRLDGDLYGSTYEALKHLYPKLSIGGGCIIDDFCLATARQAMYDYRDSHDITSGIHDIDKIGAFWLKSATTG